MVCGRRCRRRRGRRRGRLGRRAAGSLPTALFSPNVAGARLPQSWRKAGEDGPRAAAGWLALALAPPPRAATLESTRDDDEQTCAGGPRTRPRPGGSPAGQQDSSALGCACLRLSAHRCHCSPFGACIAHKLGRRHWLRCVDPACTSGARPTQEIPFVRAAAIPSCFPFPSHPPSRWPPVPRRPYLEPLYARPKQAAARPTPTA